MIKKLFIVISFLLIPTFAYAGVFDWIRNFYKAEEPQQIGTALRALPTSGGGTGISDTPSYGQMLVGNSGGTYTLTATSSLGITQDLSGYVPYTGASQDVDLGASGISADWILVGTNGASSVDLYNSSRIDFFSDTGETVLGRLNMSGAGLFNFNPTTTLGGIKGILDFSGLTTSDKTFTFPNWSGNFLIASSTSLTVGASGNVGIGTTNPGAPLHVYNTSDNLAIFEGNDHSNIKIRGTDGSERMVIFQTSIASQWSVGMDNTPAGNANDFSIKTTNNGNAEFLITTAGNVGIGTTVPYAKLQVGSDLSSSGANATDISASNVAADTGIRWGQSATNHAGFYWYYNATGANASAALFTAGYRNPIKIDGSTVLLQTGSAGNVGIGTTSPAVKLDINGYAKVLQTSTTTACSSAIEGSIFYNQANHLFWGCNGTNWLSLSN